MSEKCVGPNCREISQINIWTKLPPDSIFNQTAEKSKSAITAVFKFCLKCADVLLTNDPHARRGIYEGDSIEIDYGLFWRGSGLLTAPRPYRDSKTEKSQESFFDFAARILNVPPKTGKSFLTSQSVFAQKIAEAALNGEKITFTVMKSRGAGKADLRKWFDEIDLGKWGS